MTSMFLDWFGVWAYSASRDLGPWWFSFSFSFWVLGEVCKTSPLFFLNSFVMKKKMFIRRLYDDSYYYYTSSFTWNNVEWSSGLFCYVKLVRLWYLNCLQLKKRTAAQTVIVCFEPGSWPEDGPWGHAFSEGFAWMKDHCPKQSLSSIWVFVTYGSDSALYVNFSICDVELKLSWGLDRLWKCGLFPHMCEMRRCSLWRYSEG